MTSSVTSTHLLTTDEDFSSVFTSIQYLAADWKKIGVNLEIPYSRIRAIESSRKEVDEKLMDLVEAWLRRESEKQPKPTWKKLCKAVSTVDRTRAEAIAEEHHCGCCYCLAETRNTPVAREVKSHNVDCASRSLKEGFDEMMIFILKEVQLADAEELKYRINSFVKHERKVNETIEEHLSRIEDFVAPSAILRYLYRHEFIGYINYALLKIIQKVIRSKLLDKHMEEYEKDYQLFLRCALEDIHAAFKECPDLQPNYPVGLPSFTIHLESDWDGRSMYEWKELFERRFTWPEKLNVVKISENCIIITCTVWPNFAEDVVRDLTDPKVIADLKKEGVTIDVSPQLLAYLPFNASTTKEVCSDLEEQLRIEQLVIDEFGEGILAIKPDWDRQTATSGLGTMPDSSDKQTTTSGDGGEECRLVELQTELTLQETIETYERAWRERKTAYEHLMMKVLREKESFEEKFVSETKMRKAVVVELEQIKESYQKTPSHLQAMLTERVEELESVKKLLERINKDHHIKSLHIKSVLNV